MKKYLILPVLLFFSSLCNAENISPACTYQGIPLHGRVKVVDFAPDFTVKIVNFRPDLRVKKTSFGPTVCGEWQFVEFAPDFTVKFSDFAWDFTIQYVDYQPGL
jgi:hypothetical protein